jgi:hypothetical protein
MRKLTGMLILLSAALLSASSQAQILKGGYHQAGPGNGCVIERVDGERIPFPLRKANTKFELAENETYLLNGTIVARNGRSFFKVDFNSQPWLATERMLQNPLFPVDEGTIQVGQYHGRLVQMAVVAHMNDQRGQIEGGNGPLKLVPILPVAPIGY